MKIILTMKHKFIFAILILVFLNHNSCIGQKIDTVTAHKPNPANQIKPKPPSQIIHIPVDKARPTQPRPSPPPPPPPPEEQKPLPPDQPNSPPPPPQDQKNDALEELPTRIKSSSTTDVNGKISIRNNTNQSITFKISLNGTSVKEVVIEAGTTLTYTLEHLTIINQTGGERSPDYYYLKSGRSYFFQFNSENKWKVYQDP